MWDIGSLFKFGGRRWQKNGKLAFLYKQGRPNRLQVQSGFCQSR
jgi:hypothetical protein